MPDPALGWAALKWAWTNRTEIVGRLGAVRAWFRTDPGGRGILIIGPGGVGKTTLARILSGEFDWLLDEPWRYGESYGVEEFALKDDPKVHVTVAPGQVVRREATWADIERNLAAGTYRGVILVTAYGYHSFPAGTRSYATHPLFRGRKDEFLTAYLGRMRQDEVDVARRLAPALRTAPGKLWLLSVVTKQDLWDPVAGAARGHFAAPGELSAIIQQVGAARGPLAFRHELVAASLVISNFETPAGERLAKNVEGYDHRRQVESVRHLLEVVAFLAHWEETG